MCNNEEGHVVLYTSSLEVSTMSPQHAPAYAQHLLHKRMRWLRYSYIVFAIIASIAYFLTPQSMAQNFIYPGISLSAAIMITIGIRIYRPAQRRPWYLLILAQCCWFIGDFLWIVYDIILHQEPPFPSIADIIYLSAYPFLVLGIHMLTRPVKDWRSRASLIDASIITVGVAALSWLFLIEPVSQNTTMEPIAKLIVLAYPLVDLLLFTNILRFVMLSRTYPAAFYLIVIGLFGFLIADTQYVFSTMTNTLEGTDVFDLGWITGYVSIGIAALHPSMAYLQHRQPSDLIQLSRRRVFVMICSALIPSIALSLQYVFSQPYNIVLYVSTTIMLVFLVALRLHGMMSILDKTLAQVQYQASHDVLTGLPNRSVFLDRLMQAYHRSSRKAATCAVLFLDLDSFKAINDRWGHNLGDAVLIETARRLRTCVRPGDTVARFGGDEFTILVEEMQSIADAELVADRILQALTAPFVVGAVSIKTSSSIGIATPDANSEQLDEVIRLADIAMYHAKLSGKGRYQIYTPDMLGMVAI